VTANFRSFLPSALDAGKLLGSPSVCSIHSQWKSSGQGTRTQESLSKWCRGEHGLASTLNAKMVVRPGISWRLYRSFFFNLRNWNNARSTPSFVVKTSIISQEWLYIVFKINIEFIQIQVIPPVFLSNNTSVPNTIAQLATFLTCIREWQIRISYGISTVLRLVAVFDSPSGKYKIVF